MRDRANLRGFIAALAVPALLVAGCGGGDTSEPLPQGPPGRTAQGSVFGDDGASVANIMSGDAFGLGKQDQGDSLPVNKFLWQASLDTLSFLPLASTDPFTGVIATDWGAPPNQSSERFKVTAYMLSPALAASSLRVAVYREVRDQSGTWVPAAVDPDTAPKARGRDPDAGEADQNCRARGRRDRLTPD